MDPLSVSAKLNLCSDMRMRARLYVEEKQLHSLFESILAGLLYNRPSDPINFMRNCISMAQDLGNAPIKLTQFMAWDNEDSPAEPAHGDSVSYLSSIATLMLEDNSSTFTIFNC